ncbi:MAG TPA: hypothetical protein VI248_09335 [Kineosporiaceae bacterium]
MLVIATTEVVRAMGDLIRRADAGLARGAARNAAAGVAVRRARQLEDARTMRDLQRLEATTEARPGDALDRL